MIHEVSWTTVEQHLNDPLLFLDLCDRNEDQNDSDPDRQAEDQHANEKRDQDSRNHDVNCLCKDFMI